MKISKNIILNNIHNAKLCREELEKSILDYFKADSLEEAYQKSGLKKEVACVGFFAGAGTRWIESIKDNLDFDKSEPRCLGMVENLLNKNKEKVAIGAYNIFAFKELGELFTIYSSHKEEIQEKILVPNNTNSSFFLQKNLPGKTKVSGHGDAIRQMRELLRKHKFIISFFSNEVHSRKTIILSLLYLKILGDENNTPSCLLPVTYMKKPKYEVMIDEQNNPIGFGHEKLSGDQLKEDYGFSNIGIRIYESKELQRAIDYFEKILEKKDSYSSINKSGNDEFAQDHIDEFFMKEKKANILPIAYDYEINTAAKSIDKIQGFIEAMKKVLKEK